MNVDTYQEWTREVAIYPMKKELEYLVMGLCSEAGEVAGVAKKHIRDGKPLNDLWGEIGDVFWYLARLADHCGWNISDIIEANRTKLSDRQNRGVLGGSGDAR